MELVGGNGPVGHEWISSSWLRGGRGRKERGGGGGNRRGGMPAWVRFVAGRGRPRVAPAASARLWDRKRVLPPPTSQIHQRLIRTGGTKRSLSSRATRPSALRALRSCCRGVEVLQRWQMCCFYDESARAEPLQRLCVRNARRRIQQRPRFSGV